MVESEEKDFPTYEQMYEKFIEEGTEEGTADYCARWLLQIASPLKERFVHWWHTGELRDDFTIIGYNLSFFIEKQGSSIPFAFLNLDGIVQAQKTTPCSNPHQPAIIDVIFAGDEEGNRKFEEAIIPPSQYHLYFPDES